MGFIDENCAVFDTEEENKLSYTTLHHQFKELVSSRWCIAKSGLLKCSVEVVVARNKNVFLVP